MATNKIPLSRIVAAALAAALCLATGSSVEAADATVSENTATVVRRVHRAAAPTARRHRVPGTSLTDRQRSMVAWARGRFEAAGLDLPPVDVTFPADGAGCHGTDGRWEHRDAEADRIMVCITHDKPAVEDEWQRRTLVHELAHAWAGSTLDETDRQHFLALRGLAAWNDPSVEWGRRGTEHAAEIISWGIIDQQIHLWKLPNATCPAMTAGYRLLTGMMPATGVEESCR